MSKANMSLMDIQAGIKLLRDYALPLAKMGLIVPLPDDLIEACEDIASLREMTSTAPESLPQHHGTSEPPPAEAPAEAPDETEEIIGGPRPMETIRDAVLQVVDAEEVSVTDVTSRVEKRLNISANPSVISNELSRWAKSGHLRKVRRGVYGKPPPHIDLWPDEEPDGGASLLEAERPVTTPARREEESVDLADDQVGVGG